MQTKQSRSSWNMTRVVRIGWLGFCLLLAACHLDMYQQPKYKPNDPSAFFADGRVNRPPVPDTVAVGQFQTNPHFATGKLANGDFAASLPAEIALDAALIERGRTRYTAFCMPCHGAVGDGNGIIAQRGPITVPTFHNDRLRDVPVGYFFDVMTNGIGRMYSYASRVPPEDRWAIIAYIRALQLSQNATLEDVPPEERTQLQPGR